ncbi:hypothetical protein OE766_28895 [Pararhizobium sp. YC-54]|uniref:hypothetical protein n=1 Tax=Pararhizobium sp. YC-54 TaxID=2986920 RepID=UPI0021F79148|nr:hypothetical protein [Pararhizobium sp. YC-54]MCW0002217.1 hypothetical protein [Pararhizobium sp. YC-54]
MDNTQTTLIYKLTQLRLMIAAATVQALLRKANFNPDQPRVPAGEPGGGQWTDGGGFGSIQRRSPLNASSESSMTSGGGSYEVATTCAEHIATSCRGSVMREFPSQYLDVEIDDVRRDAQSGNAAARKALKLMFDKRFQK